MKSKIELLSRYSKYLPKGKRKPESDNIPLFRFNNARDSIKSEVARRVFNLFLEASRENDSAKLEYFLNDICYSELARLKVGTSREDEIHSIEWWRKLAQSVAVMSDTQRRDALSNLIDDYVEDTAGNFSTDVFAFTTNIVPAVIGLCFKTQDLSKWLYNPLDAFEGLRKLRDLSERFLFEGAIDRVLKLSKKGTIIALPTHSSNMDSIMIGWGLFDRGVPPMTYGAGKNLFMSPLLSYFMHNLGAYKVDRRIQNQLYKELLKTYSQVLIERGFHSLFFPGGTRSRSNHVETNLKLGLLGTTVSAYAENLISAQRDSRIFLCPLTLNYNLVLEAEALIKEFLRREGGSRYFLENDPFNDLSYVVRFAFKTMKMHATTVLRFGDPIDPFGNVVDDDGNSYDERGHLVDPSTYIQAAKTGEYVRDVARDHAYTRVTGERIAESFLKNTVLQPTHVIAWAIFEQVKQQYPKHDVFQLLRADSSVTVSWPKFRATVAELCRELKIWQNQDRLKIAPMIYNSNEETIEEGLRSLQSFHYPPILDLTAVGVHVSRLDLLYFYRNRVDSFELDRDKILAIAESSL